MLLSYLCQSKVEYSIGRIKEYTPLSSKKTFEKQNKKQLPINVFFSAFPKYKYSPTDMIFALGALMEEHRDSQKGLHCVFVALEKAYDGVRSEA